MFSRTPTRPLTDIEIADLGLVELCCGSCRARTGLLPLPEVQIADDTWYYCRCCGTEWIATDSWRDRWPPLGDLLFAATWVSFLTVTLFGIIYLVVRDDVYYHGGHGSQSPYFLLVILVAGLTWLILGILASHVLSSLENAVRWMWGTEL